MIKNSRNFLYSKSFYYNIFIEYAKKINWNKLDIKLKKKKNTKNSYIYKCFEFKTTLVYKIKYGLWIWFKIISKVMMTLCVNYVIITLHTRNI